MFQHFNLNFPVITFIDSRTFPSFLRFYSEEGSHSAGRLISVGASRKINCNREAIDRQRTRQNDLLAHSCFDLFEIITKTAVAFSYDNKSLWVQRLCSFPLCNLPVCFRHFLCILWEINRQSWLYCPKRCCNDKQAVLLKISTRKS